MNVFSLIKNAEGAITFLPRSDADLVIVDIGLPGKNGIECVKRIKEIRPEIQFLMYTVFDQEDKIFESLKVGANGYLMKTSEGDEILRAARELVNGGAPMSPSIARKIITTFRKADEDLKELDLLSTRENEILQLLSQGLTYKEIAKKNLHRCRNRETTHSQHLQKNARQESNSGDKQISGFY